ncbi:MAG: hypothetical protein EOO78_16285, partial [Oxalobacteraceae bacterium]
GELYHSSALPKEFPPAESYAGRASGILAMSISGNYRHYVIWFRPEVVQTVEWAGNPAHKEEQLEEDRHVRQRVDRECEGRHQIVRPGERPEYVEVAGADEAGVIGASVVSVRNLGTHYLAEFLVGAQPVAARLQRMPGLPGAPAWLRFPAAHTLYYIDDKRVA